MIYAWNPLSQVSTHALQAGHLERSILKFYVVRIVASRTDISDVRKLIQASADKHRHTNKRAEAHYSLV